MLSAQYHEVVLHILSTQHSALSTVRARVIVRHITRTYCTPNFLDVAAAASFIVSSHFSLWTLMI
jgi:hypothetical protein